MLGIVSDILRATWRHRRLLFATALLLRLVSLAVLWPIFGWLMRQLIAASGQDALTDQEIAAFLLSPVGLAGGLGCLVVGVAILALEQSSLLVQSFGLAQGYCVSIPAAIKWSSRNLGSTALLCLAVIVRTLLLLLPFLAALGLTYWLLLGDFDINFYLDRRPPKFWIAVGLAVSVASCAAIVIIPRLASWSLALPVLLVTGSRPLAALEASRQLIGSSRWLVAIGWLVWGLVNLIASSLFAAAVYGLARFLISSSTLWLPVLVPVLGAFLIVWLVGTLLLSLFQGISFALLISSLYRRFGWEGEHGAEVRRRLGADWLECFYRRELGATLVERHAIGRAVRLSDSADQLDRSSRRWLGLAAAIGLVAIGAGLWLLLGVNSGEDALVFAHRGAAGLRPENTLAAFELACIERADFVELDVQESADGEVIVFHDSDYMKIAGVNLKAWDATQAKLREIDIGSHFSREYLDQRTPLLRDALRLCRGRAKVDIELKYYGHNQRLVERVIEIVEQEGMVDQIVLMSLHLPFVAEAKRLRPNWTVGLLAAVGVGDLSKLEADFLAVNTRTATRDLIARAHARGKPVYVWTVDSPVLMSFYLGRGVDGIITNRPDLAREAIEHLREMSPAERLLLDSSVRLGIVPAENKTEQGENGA